MLLFVVLLLVVLLLIEAIGMGLTVGDCDPDSPICVEEEKEDEDVLSEVGVGILVDLWTEWL